MKKIQKKQTPKTAAKAKPVSAAHKAYHVSPIEMTIREPRITEKATQVAERNVYTFTVAPKASKTMIKEAIVKLYKVTPIKINVMNIKARAVVVRGKRGTQAGGRKAYVTLKKGDKIELV